MRKNSDIRWTAQGQGWTLSTAGANAVLLEMDEFQRRLGTPGALVRKGSKAEPSGLPPRAAPEITAPRMAWPAPDQRLIPVTQRTALLSKQRKTVSVNGGSECEARDDEAAANTLTVRRLSDTHVPVSAKCWRGVYNVGEAYWLAHAQPPYSPALVTTSVSDYAEGKVTAWQKGGGDHGTLSRIS